MNGLKFEQDKIEVEEEITRIEKELGVEGMYKCKKKSSNENKSKGKCSRE